MIPKALETEAVLSDDWLEAQYSAIDQALTNGKLAIDFRPTNWVELSALIALTGIVIRRAPHVRKAEFFFQPAFPWSLKTADSFIFLVRSNFFLAIQDALASHGGECNLYFALDRTPLDRFNQIRNSLFAGLDAGARELKMDQVLPFVLTSAETPALRLSLKHLDPNFRIDPSLFAPLGLSPSQQHDKFLVPITHITKREIPSYLELPDGKQAVRTLRSDCEAARASVGREVAAQLAELERVWLRELLQNVYEHGGEEAVFCVRLGDWTLREKTVGRRRVLEFGYAHRLNYLERRAPSITSASFLDVYVVDTGPGFVTLAKEWKKAKRLPESAVVDIHRLHRFALHPHTTRKPVTTLDIFSRTTGLGLVAEHVIDADGVLAIKDRDAMSYFERAHLAPTAEGDRDSKSRTDLDLTIVSAILPASDEEWANRYQVSDINVDRGAAEYLALFRAELKEHKLEWRVDAFTPDAAGHIQPGQKIEADLPQDAIRILDLSELRNQVTKSIGLNLVAKVDTLRQDGHPVLVFGATLSQMKMLQRIVESRVKLRSLGLAEDLPPHYLFFPVISSDVRLMLCGSLQSRQRESLLSALIHGQFDDTSLELLRAWGMTNLRKLPLRTIERIVNRERGRLFAEDLSKSHLLLQPVVDRHGQLLDRYYEVKSYLADPGVRARWIPDVRRIICKDKVDAVLVDCPELRSLVLESVRGSARQLAVARLDKQVLEPGLSDRHQVRKVLLLLSAAHSRTVVETVKHLREHDKVEVSKVFAMLDLTDRPSATVKEELGCDFDRFGKAEAPHRLTSGVGNPAFVVTPEERLVPFGSVNREPVSMFSSVVPRNALRPFLNQSRNVYLGHAVEHGHHYDVFIDVRRCMATSDVIGHRFRNLLLNRVADSATAIVYPEESELSPLLASVEFAPGFQRLAKLPIRSVFGESYVWVHPYPAGSLKGARVILLDEGMYTGDSLFGALRLLVKEIPSHIDVVLLEKRATDASKIEDIERILGQVKGETTVGLWCLLDVPAPSWRERECPYCRCEIAFGQREPRKLDKVIHIPGQPDLTHDFDLRLWLLEGLYGSRREASDRLALVDKLHLECRQIAAEAVSLLLIHHPVLDRLNLLDDALTIVQRLLRRLDSSSRCTALRLAAASPDSTKNECLGAVFATVVPTILDPLVSLEVYELLRRERKSVSIFSQSVASMVLSENCRGRLDQIMADSQSDSRASAVALLFALTKINRAPHHTRLAQEIKTYGPERVAEKLTLLRRIIGLEVIKGEEVIQKMADSIDRPAKLADLLCDPRFIDEVNGSFCMRADSFLSILGEAIQSTPSLEDLRSLRRRRADGRGEMPLICMGRTLKEALCEHLASNLGYGQLSFQAPKITSQDMILHIRSEKGVTTSLDDARNSAALNQLRPFMSIHGAEISYDLCRDGSFLIRLCLRVVDHVQVQNDHL